MEPRFVPTINNVILFKANGPWDTKSGGKLNVILAIPLCVVQNQYFCYEDAELHLVPGDIRGLRIYTVRDLPDKGIGGQEWHRIREEMVFVLGGSVKWTFEDLFGNQRTFILNPEVGLWMPPFILHSYEALEMGSELLVIANTLFDANDPRTHDTFPKEDFRKLQTKYTK